MHEIDRGVRFEQVAPGPLAGMRLAGDQQHAQLVAHAVDRDHGAVVDCGQFAGERRRFDLDDVRPAMRDRNIDVAATPDRDSARFDDVAVAAHRHLGGAFFRALILDPIGDGLRLADDAEARRGDEARRGGRARSCCPVISAWTGAAKPSAPASAGTSWTRPSVIMMAPAMRSGGTSASAEPSAVNKRVPSVSPSDLSGLHDAHVEPGNAAQPIDDRGARGFGLLRALAEILARALVDDDDGDRRSADRGPRA